MKKEFIGFYDPTEKEINNAWTKGIFTFDANTLLNLYRYTELTRKDFLSALKTIKDKLFIPNQAAYEYHSNRISVIESLNKSYSTLLDIIKQNYDDNLKTQINQFKKHPSIKIDGIYKLHSEFIEKVSKELDNQKKSHPDFYTKDEVLNELTELFENHIGKEFSKEDLKKIYSEGKERYAELIPPGFKDLESKRKRGERHIYGDLIIWKELINYSKKEKRLLIFVTDDRKEDWWTIENGETIRPREELIKEFYDLTGIRILIYNAEIFLQYAKEKKLVPQLKDNTIKDVKEIRLSDEKTNLSRLAGTLARNIGYTTMNNNLARLAGVLSGDLGYTTMNNDMARLAGVLSGDLGYTTMNNDMARIAGTLSGNFGYGSSNNYLARLAEVISSNPSNVTFLNRPEENAKFITSNSTNNTAPNNIIEGSQPLKDSEKKVIKIKNQNLIIEYSPECVLTM